MDDRAATVAPRVDYDLIVELLGVTLTLLEVDRTAARRHIVQARSLALGPNPAAPAARGGLADWQMRRIATFVHFNLSTRLRIEQVAQELKMSPSYLSRAFKATTSITYSEFVLRARLDLAKWLLLTTETPICEIALACGLADQSHLTRIFKRSTGLPPRAWRRRLGCGAIERPLIQADDALLPPADNARQEMIVLSRAEPWRDRRMVPMQVGAWRDPREDGRFGDACDGRE